MKRQILWAIISIIMIGAIAYFGRTWINHGGFPANGPIGAPQPVYIQYVSPQDGGQVLNSHGFCVGFDFQVGNTISEAQQKDIRFFIDGNNVKDQIYELVELEYPTGIAEPCFRQDEPLEPGWHTAVVKFTDSKDFQFDYRWSFYNTIDD